MGQLTLRLHVMLQPDMLLQLLEAASRLFRGTMRALVSVKPEKVFGAVCPAVSMRRGVATALGV
jgi:hypothetical protein